MNWNNAKDYWKNHEEEFKRYFKAFCEWQNLPENIQWKCYSSLLTPFPKIWEQRKAYEESINTREYELE
jgi:hypothetical protein